MERFKYLDHTSEAKFQAFGQSLDEAFANAGLAMANLITQVDEVKPVKKRDFHIDSSSQDAMLFDFLDQVLYVMDAEFLYPHSISVRINGNNLTAEMMCDDAKNCPKGSEVKAPTYDEMKIEQTKDFWMVQVVVDV